MNPEQLNAVLSDQVKLTSWAKEPTVNQLHEDLVASKPTHDALMADIRKWRDLHAGKGKFAAKAEANRSSVQPKLVRKQAEWRYPALSEPFLGSQKLFEVTPVSFEDTDSAHQNELLLNYQFRTKLNKVNLIDNMVRGFVDEGTCIFRLGWHRSTHTEKTTAPVWEHYAIQSQDDMDMLQRAVQMQQENPNGYEHLPEPLKAAVEFMNETGTPTIARQIGEQEVENEVVDENHPTVELMNPDNVYVDPSCNGDLHKALFVIVTFETNKAELLKKSNIYKNLDKVNWDSASPTANTDHSSSTPSDFNFKDATRKKVVAYEYWGMYDIHGDGKLVPIVATWIGQTMIRMQENPFPDGRPPFVLATYSPKKRSLYGETDAELLEDNQQILGAVTRGMIDLLGRSANSQQGFAKGMLDPLNRRRYDQGKDYEFNPQISPANGLITHTYPEIPQSALAIAQLQNTEAESLTGVKAFSGGLSGTAYGDVAAGIRGMLDAAAKREMSILRRLAQAMQEVGRKIISMNAAFLSESEVVRVTNEEFVEIRREDLGGDYDLVVDISTAEIDNTKAQDLAFILQTTGQSCPPEILMRILSEIARLKRMPELAHSLKTYQPQPDPVAEELKQLQLQEAKLKVAKLESEIAVNHAKARDLGATSDQKNLDFIEQESGTKHARMMQQQQAQAEGNQKLQVTKALADQGNTEAAIGYNEISRAEA